MQEVKEDNAPGTSETESYYDNEIVTDLEAPPVVEEIATLNDHLLPDFLSLGTQK